MADAAGVGASASAGAGAVTTGLDEITTALPLAPRPALMPLCQASEDGGAEGVDDQGVELASSVRWSMRVISLPLLPVAVRLAAKARGSQVAGRAGVGDGPRRVAGCAGQKHGPSAIRTARRSELSAENATTSGTAAQRAGAQRQIGGSGDAQDCWNHQKDAGGGGDRCHVGHPGPRRLCDLRGLRPRRLRGLGQLRPRAHRGIRPRGLRVLGPRRPPPHRRPRARGLRGLGMAAGGGENPPEHLFGGVSSGSGGGIWTGGLWVVSRTTEAWPGRQRRPAVMVLTPGWTRTDGTSRSTTVRLKLLA